MALIRINADGRTPRLHGAGQGLEPTLRRVLATPGPIAIMIHGFRFQPADPAHCPHHHILSLKDTAHRKALSWPRHLGFDSQGVGIAFGWTARGSLKQALKAALRASRALAALIATLHRLAPHRPVHLIAHSMGGFLALRALPHAPAGAVGRVILLNAAAFERDAIRALASPAGRRAELFNISSRENAPYDYLFARLLRRRDRLLGRGLNAPNALTLRLDDRQTLDHLATLGFPIAPRRRMVCHWSTYLRPGVFPFYRSLIHEPARLPLAQLQTLCRLTSSPRRLGFSLPLWPKPASWPSQQEHAHDRTDQPLLLAHPERMESLHRP
ncbi:alpha/beta fold hydrolase [Shimia aestuarii]|uniref:Uncharacterized protein n=1 Tax=Shimia aestuarii TaxID=254406 RepID=A0A1I4J4J2_9RHOB|nr:alpha/beta fold hydrolase [Shimia aestuarii]SFL61051.1 Alpha/beta hydrolase of unknown function [Shimia aestuarii]